MPTEQRLDPNSHLNDNNATSSDTGYITGVGGGLLMIRTVAPSSVTDVPTIKVLIRAGTTGDGNQDMIFDQFQPDEIADDERNFPVQLPPCFQWKVTVTGTNESWVKQVAFHRIQDYNAA